MFSENNMSEDLQYLKGLTDDNIKSLQNIYEHYIIENINKDIQECDKNKSDNVDENSPVEYKTCFSVDLDELTLQPANEEFHKAIDEISEFEFREIILPKLCKYEEFRSLIDFIKTNDEKI